MKETRPEGMRWVVNGVQLDTVKMVKQLAANHEVYMCEVVDAAIATLWHCLYDEGYLPEGWTEY